MGQVKNVVDDMDCPAMNSEKRKLGIRTEVELRTTTQIGKSLFRFQESLG
jgi:hypothetical protein